MGTTSVSPIEIDQAISYGFEDFPEDNESNLGSYTAEENAEVANASYGTVIITAECESIKWGIFEKQSACFVSFGLSFQAEGRTFREGVFELKLEVLDRQVRSPTTEPIQILRLQPVHFVGEPSSRVVEKQAGLSLSGGFAGGSAGVTDLVSIKITDQRVGSFSIIGVKTTGSGQLYTGAKWVLKQDRVQKHGIIPYCRVAVVLKHNEKPFALSFKVDGKTGRFGGGLPGFLKPEKPRKEIREFTPVASSEVLRAEELLTYVDEVLRPPNPAKSAATTTQAAPSAAP